MGRANTCVYTCEKEKESIDMRGFGCILWVRFVASVFCCYMEFRYSCWLFWKSRMSKVYMDEETYYYFFRIVELFVCIE